MKIKINEKNRNKISALLDKVQKRSKVRTITIDRFYQEVSEVTIEMIYQNRVLKKQLHKFHLKIDPCHEKFPSAYKWEPLSTQFWIAYNKQGQPLLTRLERYGTDVKKVKNITFFRGKNYEFETEKYRQGLLLAEQKDVIYNGFLRAY